MARFLKDQKTADKGRIAPVTAWGCAAAEDSRPPVSCPDTRFKAPKFFAQVKVVNSTVIGKPARLGERTGAEDSRSPYFKF